MDPVKKMGVAHNSGHSCQILLNDGYMMERMFVKTRLNCKKIAQFAQKQEMQKGKGEWLFLLGLNDDLIFLVHQSQR